MAEVATHAIARWGQLTYSSFDAGGGRGGGWQVKQTSGELTTAEQDFLRSQISTQFRLLVPLPAYPTQQEIADLPARLVYTPAAEGAAAYWHTVPAGNDSTGRPGNVFAHSLLDRDRVVPDPPLRPIELWRSSGWLCPFGASKVLEATLSTEPTLARCEVVNVDTVIDFIFDAQVWRLGVLIVLLDAVAAAMEGREQIVLIAPTDHEGAMWIAAVSYLMSPVTARELSFSTYETWDTLSSAVARGLQISVVPLADETTLKARDGVVIINTVEDIELGDLHGEPHRTLAGSQIPVTEWSVMAQALLQDQAMARRSIRAMEEIATKVGDRGLHAAWPMAWLIATGGGDLAEVVDEAADVLGKHSPDAVRRDTELLAEVTTVVGHRIGSSAARAWAALTNRSYAEDSVARAVALTTYLRLAPWDSEWLLQSDAAPVPEQTAHDVLDRLAAESAFDDAVEHLLADAQDFAGSPSERLELSALALRLVDFGVRAGLKDLTARRPPPPPWSGPLPADGTDRLLREVAPVFMEPLAAAPLIDKVGRLDLRTYAALRKHLEPLLSRPAAGRLLIGEQIQYEVLDWVFDYTPWAASLEQLSAGEVRLTALMSEYAVAHVSRSEVDLRVEPLAPSALWALLSEPLASGSPQAVIAARLVDAHINADNFSLIDRAFPDKVPDHVIIRILQSEPLSKVRGMLAWIAGAAPGTYSAQVQDLTSLRKSASYPWWSMGADLIRREARAIVDAVAGLVPGLTGQALYEELGSAVVIACVVMVAGWERSLDPARFTPPGDRYPPAYPDMSRRGYTDGASRRVMPSTRLEKPSALLDEKFWETARMFAQHARPADVRRALRTSSDSGVHDRALLEIVSIYSPQYPLEVDALNPMERGLYSLQFAADNPFLSPLDTVIADRIRNGRSAIDQETYEELLLDRSRRALFGLPFGVQDETQNQCRRFARTRWRELAGENGVLGRTIGKLKKGP